jgi:hypothetical protein
MTSLKGAGLALASSWGRQSMMTCGRGVVSTSNRRAAALMPAKAGAALP